MEKGLLMEKENQGGETINNRVHLYEASGGLPSDEDIDRILREEVGNYSLAHIIFNTSVGRVDLVTNTSANKAVISGPVAYDIECHGKEGLVDKFKNNEISKEEFDRLTEFVGYVCDALRNRGINFTSRQDYIRKPIIEDKTGTNRIFRYYVLNKVKE